MMTDCGDADWDGEARQASAVVSFDERQRMKKRVLELPEDEYYARVANLTRLIA